MIKQGDTVYCEGAMTDIEGIAVRNVDNPYDEEIKLHTDDGTVVIVKGWLCDLIIVNDVEI